MLTILTIFSTSFVIALSGALMPGPLFTVTVSESSHRGGKVGPLMILGHSILELLLVVGLLAGLGPLLRRSDVFIGVSLVGGIILFWMGWSMLRELGKTSLQDTGETPQPRNLIWAGILLSISNPYWLIWWATIGIGYIVYSQQFGIAGIAAFFLGHIIADLAWYSFISLGISRGRQFFSDSLYRKVIFCCALFLIVFSGYFFYSGIEKIYSQSATVALNYLESPYDS